ncbi:MAG: bifunctional metallophosphatase/5'-nucleotidase [Gammaproteobacteria bacterium]|nr:bifunctional metallophosphatase/5'-nucleotidase [Gammaproteobacteria bacterium]
MRKMTFAASAMAVIASLAIIPSTHAGDGTVTLIHTGDFHGHLVPRPNVRSDNSGRMEGGLARVAAKIKAIRAANSNTLLLHTGDTIQGSAEVLYTRGQAILDVLNLSQFGIQGFAPGNWEFVYGTQRFLELFAGATAKAPWNAVAANLYYSTLAEDPTTPYPDKAGQRVLPPYFVKTIGKVKVGVMGFTTDRGPTVVGSAVTKGFKFTKGDAEVVEVMNTLRNVEGVDLIVMISELGLANNIRLAEANPGINVILSSDMHEETQNAVVTSTGTLIVEEGQDGTMMGQLKVTVRNRAMSSYVWTPINVNDTITPDTTVAAKILQVRRTFVSGPFFTQYPNPFNGSLLQRPINTIVGYTSTALHRSNFSHETMPGVIEGSSHDFLTDAFRAQTGANIGAIRGFRYGTHVPAGAIRMEDLYHFIPIGPQIAIGNITGQQLKNQIEAAANGSLDPVVKNWTGGWLFNYSGVTMDLDPYLTQGSRASNIRIDGVPLNLTGSYSYASYWYATDPAMINAIPAGNITLLKDSNGQTLDATEVVVRYLQSLPGQTANPTLNRISLLKPLPSPQYGFSVIQPLQGAK